ncbi:MAG: hypothetical protein KDD45_13155, partial [Bdellovibrionales bacterium]|nr:hypothetical protein [Bdellovibrionales bacterium]
GDSKVYSKLFGGLWYQPPYSSDFETYFGITNREAKALFCFENPVSSFSLDSVIPLKSTSYENCLGSSSFNCTEIPAYVEANQTRLNLQNSIKESLSDPFQAGLRPINTCYWEKIEGPFNSEFQDVLISWINSGYKIAIYFDDDHPRCEQLENISSEIKGNIKAAAYFCDDF